MGPLSDGNLNQKTKVAFGTNTLTGYRAEVLRRCPEPENLLRKNPPRKQTLLPEVPARSLFPVYHLFAIRRIRQKPLLALFVTLSVALTVAVSLVITALISENVRILSAQVLETKLPFDALAIFPDHDSLQAFLKRKNAFGKSVSVETFRVGEFDSNLGPLTVMDIGKDLPPGTISLLFEVQAEMFLQKTHSDGDARSLIAWTEASPQHRLEWSSVEVHPIAREKTDPGGTSWPKALWGWALVSPGSLDGVPGTREGVQFILGSGTKTLTREEKEMLFRNIERLSETYPGTKVITPLSGKTILEREARRCFGVFQLVSFGVLLGSSIAIACVLTVSFLGRKRALGILRVLGGTAKDLRNMMLVEAMYLGIPGIFVGLIAGTASSNRIFGTFAYPSSLILAGIMGASTLLLGVWMPLRLIRNANCDQLLNQRAVYIISNPSCASCGLCGGF